MSFQQPLLLLALVAVPAAIQDMRPGQSVAVEVRRGGDSRTLQVELGNRAGRTP